MHSTQKIFPRLFWNALLLLSLLTCQSRSEPESKQSPTQAASIQSTALQPETRSGDTPSNSEHFQNQSQDQIKVDVKSCHDGDTCTLYTKSGLWFHARLAGIDAPEVGRYGRKSDQGQTLGPEARDALLAMLHNGKNISIKQLDLDPYNRPIVEIFAGQVCANIKMLELGLAERYRGRTKQLDTARYDAAENQAKLAKRGIWGLKSYKSPSDWRKSKKD